MTTETDISALALIAEISIGLIGFAGIVAVLARSRMPAAVRSFRLTALMMNGAIALFGSLVPIVILKYDVSQASLWVIAAGFVILMQGGVLVWASGVIKGLLRSGQIPQKITYFVLALVGLVWAYLLYGVLFDRETLPAIYLVVLVSSMLVSLFHFVMLVVSVQSVES
jgi:hypothetical protein